jgi:hypothetical protein
MAAAFPRPAIKIDVTERAEPTLAALDTLAWLSPLGQRRKCLRLAAVFFVPTRLLNRATVVNSDTFVN